jgi:23S rRNA (cytidine1920-2'-O)/16S rRNA (cytidine1409-2'-O)-methyltransferase
MPYVSRAGDKLEHALKTFKIDPTDATCADFGASTGGFVDCWLQSGALKVYAVETGYGVLEWKLREDERVIVKERSNAMHIELPEQVDFLSIDTSWTRLDKVIPNALKNLKDNGTIIALLKPHYEAEARQLRKGKLAEEFIPEILDKVKAYLPDLGASVLDVTESPVVGKKGGNKEFLLHINKA